MSPRKSLLSPSPRKLLISPRKLMSPTAFLPNLMVNGKSPHLPNRSTGKKKQSSNWLTASAKRLKSAKCEENKKTSQGKPEAKKNLTKSLQECTADSAKTPSKKRKK